jgi:hypothetical protein
MYTRGVVHYTIGPITYRTVLLCNALAKVYIHEGGSYNSETIKVMSYLVTPLVLHLNKASFDNYRGYRDILSLHEYY